MEKRALDFVEQEMESEPKKIRSRRSHSNLVQWLDMHKSNPYPTKVEKEQLAINSGMTIRQINDWFANARRNIRKIGFEAWRKRKFACFDGESPDIYIACKSRHKDTAIIVLIDYYWIYCNNKLSMHIKLAIFNYLFPLQYDIISITTVSPLYHSLFPLTLSPLPSLFLSRSGPVITT